MFQFCFSDHWWTLWFLLMYETLLFHGWNQSFGVEAAAEWWSNSGWLILTGYEACDQLFRQRDSLRGSNKTYFMNRQNIWLQWDGYWMKWNKSILCLCCCILLCCSMMCILFCCLSKHVLNSLTIFVPDHWIIWIGTCSYMTYELTIDCIVTFGTLNWGRIINGFFYSFCLTKPWVVYYLVMCKSCGKC